MTSLLSVRDLSVVYSRDGKAVRALDAVSFDLQPGEKLAIVGESGSGKSTLGLAVSGLLPPGSSIAGTINWRGTNVAPRAGADVGVVFQDPLGSLDPLMRVGDQVTEVVQVLSGLSLSESKSITQELLTRVGLDDSFSLAKAYPHQLSGGQAQRVAITCALAGKPQLLISDEATSALDTIVQARIVELINRLVAKERLTLMLVTHDLALARSMCDRLLVLQGGRVVCDGEIRPFLQASDNSYLKRLIDAHISLTDQPRLTAAPMLRAQQ